MQLFDAQPTLPPVEDHEQYLSLVLQHLSARREIGAERALQEFVGEASDARTLGVTEIHHVAAYVGDYLEEAEFERWCASVQDSPLVSDVQFGPSYISPRLYGTPGHWMNFTSKGYEWELFSCRRAGAWAALPHGRKLRLMSHDAVRVAAGEQVAALLSFLSVRYGLEQIAYTATDEVGHCYGHLRRKETDQVLEIVYSADHME